MYCIYKRVWWLLSKNLLSFILSKQFPKHNPICLNIFYIFLVRQMIKLKQSKKNLIWMINFLQVREIKQTRDNGDFSLTEYNTRDKIKHTNKLNTESVLCSSNICVLCYFKIILRPRRNQLMMEANQKVQEINVKLNECKPKSEIKSRSKSWYVLEVEKQKSSQIGSVLTVNLF